jgi:hypothetical protein
MRLHRSGVRTPSAVIGWGEACESVGETAPPLALAGSVRVSGATLQLPDHLVGLTAFREFGRRRS